jgi:hypothetical protein
MASAGDVPGARAAAATLAPFWDAAVRGRIPGEGGRTSGLFGKALRAADAAAFSFETLVRTGYGWLSADQRGLDRLLVAGMPDRRGQPPTRSFPGALPRRGDRARRPPQHSPGERITDELRG